MSRKIIFAADFYKEQFHGGAELNDDVLLNKLEQRGYNIEKKSCSELTLNYLSSLSNDTQLILGNFVTLSEESKSYIMNNIDYIIYEHDHKYDKKRDPSRFPNYQIPEKEVINRDFYSRAKKIVALTKLAKEVMEKNLRIDNIVSIGTSMFSDESLDHMKSLQQIKKEYEHVVVKNKNVMKGTQPALDWCSKNNIEPTLISSSDYKKFLSLLAKAETLVFVPQFLETFCRLIAEAKALNCKVITKEKMVGFASEESFKMAGEELIEELRTRTNKAVDLFETILQEQKEKEEKQKMNIVSYKRLYKEIDVLCHKIASSNIRIDAVVPALRSGMIPAYKIAERLNLPIMIEEKLYGGLRLSYDRNIKNILLVDDSINTGTNLKNELEKYRKRYNIYTCAVIASNYHKNNIDFYATVVETPRVFEWNMFNSANTSKIMFDMDGVICIDPRVYDDDGEKYKNEIKNIPHLFVPKYPVHSIVTNRIERWRSVTEEWLKAKSVKYGKLVMQQFETAVERRKESDPGEYKAKHYKDSDAVLFIESDLLQATKIFKISQKPVFCIESNNFFGVD